MKSGYRIRRKAWTMGAYHDWIDKSYVVGRAFKIQDFLATDWEIDFRDMINDSGIEVLYKEPPSDEEE